MVNNLITVHMCSSWDDPITNTSDKHNYSSEDLHLHTSMTTGQRLSVIKTEIIRYMVRTRCRSYIHIFVTDLIYIQFQYSYIANRQYPSPVYSLLHFELVW